MTGYESFKKELERRSQLSPSDLGYVYSLSDFYFSLLLDGGLTKAIEVANGLGHEKHAAIMESWVEAGMTDAESKCLHHNSKKLPSCNKVYYWKGHEICSESYGVNTPRHKCMVAMPTP